MPIIYDTILSTISTLFQQIVNILDPPLVQFDIYMYFEKCSFEVHTFFGESFVYKQVEIKPCGLGSRI